jgi:hypothetical protein
MKKKIYGYLTGGLGNQLFQYCAYKNIAIKNNAILILDPISGFLTDFLYKRKFLLYKLKFKATKVESNFIIFFILRILKKFFFRKFIYSFHFFDFINEFFDFKKYNPIITNINFKKKLFIMGQFQSEKYFLLNKSFILKEVCPPKPKKKIFLETKKVIALNNSSVAVCIRSFEDTPIKLHNRLGGVENIHFYNNSLKIILKKISNPSFYFFSNNISNIKNFFHKSSDFSKYPIKFITPQTGFIGDFENLWLLSNFKNLIISNSTYYWWGAYFSTQRFPENIVVTSSKFPNKDTNLKKWLLVY